MTYAFNVSGYTRARITGNAYKTQRGFAATAICAITAGRGRRKNHCAGEYYGDEEGRDRVFVRRRQDSKDEIMEKAEKRQGKTQGNGPGYDFSF